MSLPLVRLACHTVSASSVHALILPQPNVRYQRKPFFFFFFKTIFQNQKLTAWDENEADKTLTSKVVNVKED